MDWMVPVGPKQDFVVFGDDGQIGLEEIVSGDLEPIIGRGLRRFASMAWSSGCQWYFLLLPDAIALFSVADADGGEGVLCKKKSARFFEMLMDAPIRSRRR